MAALSNPKCFSKRKTVMSRAFGVRFKAFIAVAVITIGIFVFSVVSAAEPELSKASRFDHVGFSFSDGRNTFVQVRDHGLEVLWDPISKVEAPASTGLLSKLTRFTDLLSPSQVDSIPKENQRDGDVTALAAHHCSRSDGMQMDTNESGLALKHDIQAKYQLLKHSGMITGSIEGNDISALVATHIRTGMSFAEAENTLRAAGLTVNPRPGIDNPRGRFDPYDVYASSLTLATGALTYPNVEVRITISPDNPKEYKFVHAVHGWIFVRGL